MAKSILTSIIGLTLMFLFMFIAGIAPTDDGELLAYLSVVAVIAVIIVALCALLKKVNPSLFDEDEI